jgi:hypothetical protein
MKLPDITTPEELEAYHQQQRQHGELSEYVTRNVGHQHRLSSVRPMDAATRANNPGFVAGRSWGPHAWFGTKDMKAMFNKAPTTPIPFPGAGKSKTNYPYEQDKVLDLVQNAPEGLRELDPRYLIGTQSGITLDGLQYYMGDEYEETGQVYRDRDQAGNVYPVVYERESERGIEPLILSGHHRASAALLKGEALRALVVRGRQGRPYDRG